MSTLQLHEQCAADEELLGLLRHALRLDAPPVAPESTRRLIRRTKEFLDATFATRIQLSQVGAAVGASPAYVTDVFRRYEGISLQRYVTQLRLARALIELPHAMDLTMLALDLGFSSHSHFTFAFRRSFGCTPSQFRRMTPGSSRSPDPLRLSALIASTAPFARAVAPSRSSARESPTKDRDSNRGAGGGRSSYCRLTFSDLTDRAWTHRRISRPLGLR